jgi:hypothetical protein
MTKTKTQAAEVNHKAVAWALAAVAAPEVYDLRAEIMLRDLLDAHTSCAYDLDGQDKGKGQRAYARLVALAGGPEGSPEPEPKASCAWTCWTMRRIRNDFYAPADAPGEARYLKAWREVESLLFPLWKNRPPNKFVHEVLPLLPALVMRKGGADGNG